MIKKIKLNEVIILVLILAAVVLLLYAAVFADNLLSKNKLKKEFDDIESKIECELLAEIRINKEVSQPLKLFSEIVYNQSEENLSERVVDYPVHRQIYNIEDQKIFEKLYDVKIPVELDYNKKYIYVTMGSEIENFEIFRVHEDELSKWKPRAYDTIIHYKEPYDANFMYLYYIYDVTLWLYDEDEIEIE